jgi:hypothetical protein
MWIIPKNLHTSRYVADMKELGVDCEQFSQLSEKSLMWRSKPTASPTWSKRWKRVSWIQHLSTLILKPSHSKSFVERWTSSLEDSLVSPSQMRECVAELKTQDISLPQMVEYDPSSRLVTDSPVDLENVKKNGKHLESQGLSKAELQRSSGKLNSDWVEQLMGLPIGSTDLGSWGTELFHK